MVKQLYSEKNCLVCGGLFAPKASVHYYCSPECKGRMQYINGRGSTENQYKRISQNWRKYLMRLIYGKGASFNVDYLMRLLVEQNYRCAISGHALTCTLGKGMTCFTNASIDRIIPGSEYKEGNVRLVCRIANIMKWNMSDDEFITLCRRILEYDSQR